MVDIYSLQYLEFSQEIAFMFLYFEVSLTLIFGFGRSNLGLQSSSNTLWAICESKERMPILKNIIIVKTVIKKLKFFALFWY